MSTDVLLAAAIAFAVVGMLHLWFARDEIYLNWLLPVALLGMFAAYIAINEAVARAALARTNSKSPHLQKKSFRRWVRSAESLRVREWSCRTRFLRQARGSLLLRVRS